MDKKVIIFGGAGFVGTQLTKRLIENDFKVKVICTNKDKAKKIIGSSSNLTFDSLDIFSLNEIKNAIAGYDYVINLIGKLYEVKSDDFYNYHELFVGNLCQSLEDWQYLIHLSSLGVETSKTKSKYAATKYAAEVNIKENAKIFTIIKPSVIFGVRDNFFNMFSNMAKYSPFLPLVGKGETLFSPVYVEDLVTAIIKIMAQENSNGVYAACGPDTDSFKNILKFLLTTIGKRRFLVQIPSSIAKIQATIINSIGIYLLTPDQVELLKFDNINANKLPNIDTLIGKMTSYKGFLSNKINS